MMSKSNFIGQQIGNYRLIAEVASGAYGKVYRGKHVIFDDEPVVALKLLHTYLNSSQEQERFFQEARLLRKLKHPYILPILDAGLYQGLPYFVTEYASRGSLQTYLHQNSDKPLPLEEAAKFLSQMGEALHYAHQQKIVHRDLKPDNILLNSHSDVLLADFGIAVVLETARTQKVGRGGTPFYMAPEQFEGMISAKSDQYALGFIAYEMLTGSKPFQVPNPSIEALWYHHAQVQPTPPTRLNPSLSPDIERALLQALAKRREDRHTDVLAFISMLCSSFNAETLLATQPASVIPEIIPVVSNLEKENEKTFREKGLSLEKLNRYEDALEAYEQALRLNPTDAWTARHKGLALVQLKRFRKASLAMSTYMLEPGQELLTETGMACKVVELLDSEGQGEVYKVSIANKPMALKWYFPDYVNAEQQQALDLLIKKGPPNDKFLWPLELIYSKEKSELGYLMPLREDRYKNLVDLMKRTVQTTFRCLATAGLQLADSYYQLHVHGLCARDISFGNVFFDPQNGEVLICDNDNVTINDTKIGGVLGTAKFMAPEIVRHEAVPSRSTDLYSLSVLLFYLLMSHHPLEGKHEADIHILDAGATEKIYGREPLFIFDPQDDSNRPVKGYHDNALIFWPLYPQSLRNLFTRAFTDGLRDPEYGRVTETEWRSEMVNLCNSIFYCPHCDSQNFYDIEDLRKNGGRPNPCWSCHQKDIQLPFCMHINNTIIMLNHDTQLFPHHVDRNRKWDFSRPIAMVSRHPKDPNACELKNISDEKWVLTKADGSRQDVKPQRSALLVVGSTIHFGNLDGEIRYS